MATDIEVLDNVIRATAAIDSTDGLSGMNNQPIDNILRAWLNDPELLSRVTPLIRARYQTAMRWKDDDGAAEKPPLHRQPVKRRLSFRHFRPR